MQTTAKNATIDRMVTPKEFAEVLGVSPHTIYRMLARGELVAAKVCSAWRINANASLARLGM